MPTYRDIPYSSFNFLVETGFQDAQSVIGGFSEVSLPEIQIETIEYRVGNSKENTPLKLPGLTRYTNLVLKRGLIGSSDLFDWVKEASNGSSNAWRNISVLLLDEQRNPVVVWRFVRAFPVNYSFSTLEANSSQIVVERLELAVGGMTVE
jgi:phage tail-like protein